MDDDEAKGGSLRYPLRYHLIWATVIAIFVLAVAGTIVIISVNIIDGNRDGNQATLKDKQICAEQHGNWDKVSSSCYFR